MINNIKEMTEIPQVKEKSINYDILNLNVKTGYKEHIYLKLKQSFKTATTIDIIVLLEYLKEALKRGVKMKMLTKKIPKNKTPISTIPIKVRIKR